MATMVFGDQASVPMWASFFNSTTGGSVDLAVVSGGHQTQEMLVTLMQTFNHLTPGGMIAFEDLHNSPKSAIWLDPFFKDAVGFISRQSALGQVASLHFYPFLMLLQRAG